MNTFQKAISALLATVFLWSLMVVIARFTVATYSPFYVLFLRLSVGSIAFLPFFIKHRTWAKRGFKKLALISLGSTVNLTFFMIGIKYTTASTSQIIYAAMPLLVLVVDKLVLEKSHGMKKIGGVLIGFTGLISILYLSAIEKGETITGTLFGNILIVIAMLGWSSYVYTSKHLSKTFSPIEIGSVSILLSEIVATVLLLTQLPSLGNLSLTPALIFASLYMGFFGTFITYILFQYAVHHLSALNVSLSSYIQPITTTLLAIVFLGEKITPSFIGGSVLILTGIFLSGVHSQQKQYS